MKKIFSILILVLCSFMLFSCYTDEPKKPVDPNTPVDPSDPDKSVDPSDAELPSDYKEIIETKSFTDHAGNKIQIEEELDRVVSAYYSSTTLCLALGLEENLVAIEKKADTRGLYKQAFPEIINLPQVSTKKEINVEETLNTNPNLVILPLSLKDSANQFTKLGIEVIVVNPETRKEIEETVIFIGVATGHIEEALKYINYNRETIKEVESLVKDEEKPTVYLAGGEILETVTKDYFQTVMIDIAGGVSVSNELSGNGWTIVSKEEVISWNPKYLFYNQDASYTLEDIKSSSIKDIDAIQNNRIYQIPSKLENWDTNNASSILGILWMTAILHEDLYTLDDVYNEAKEFYQDFFNFTPTKEDLGL